VLHGNDTRTEETLQITAAQLSTARAEIETSTAQLDQAHAQRQASEARESKLLDALRALGAEPRVSTER
jgi:septal ring factor EnvC (AmiA/AmiB activator)